MPSKRRFLLAAGLFVLCVVGGVAVLLDWVQSKQFEHESRQRADVVSHFGTACRSYAKSVLRPAVQAHTHEMIFEAMSSTFVARGIFASFNEKMPKYRFRQATLNPLNLDNKADAFERDLIARFAADPTLKEITGFRDDEGHGLFFVARPVVVEAKCIQCHDTPEKAPPAIAKRYGREHGFGWQQGETVAALMISIPTDDLVTQQASMRLLVLSTLAALAVVLISVSYFLFGKIHKNAAELQDARQAAEAACRVKSQFLANMSHEIRTPMTAILGYTELLIDRETVRGLPREDVEIFQTIRRNGEHLLDVINDILDISKIESGNFKIELIECSLDNVLSDVVSLMQGRALQKGLSLDVTFVGDVPTTIRTDPTRLGQILINLMGNAIKFTESGRVGVSVSLADTEDGDARLQFVVSDTGIGMTKVQLGNLFLPFAQADPSITRKFGGTGLGLAISKHLTELLGGHISIQSKIGRGSTITFTIEVGSLDRTAWMSDASALSIKQARQVCPRNIVGLPDGVRILLAEDGLDNQRLIKAVLKKVGADVTVAENGAVAVELALHARRDDRPFGVILMDMQMPVLDGYGATRELRKYGYSGAIVALTAHAMASDRAKCLDAGCDDYATKPINRHELIEMVARYCQQQIAPLGR